MAVSIGLSLLASPTPVSAASLTYTVVRGDSLYAVAHKQHMSLATLERINHLNDASVLALGQQLRLAAPTSNAHTSTRTRVAEQTRSLNKRISRMVSAQRPSTVAAIRAWSNVGHREAASRMAESQAVWVATHTSGTYRAFSWGPALATAQRTIAFEVSVTKTALRFIGVPYAWGGTSFAGVDCSGFVQTVFHRNGINLPRTADAQYASGQRVRASGMQPGDLVFFQTYSAGASHVGIYLGGGRFIHASSSNGVRVDSMSENYYASRFIGARRTI
ncbi:MAG: C40 family peptidase [Candidatus Eremiobacter antarcticus]|nr:C40 family peptidase [Candidatus Eremiobacteraeota bacterium]MBC5808877.1 C40 family peptidase [Candidatus Eremiobacteraeota bacterium]